MPKVVHDQAVFRAVMQIVTERGYTGATTKQMAEVAGVSEVTLFRKYGNKADLVKQTVAFTIAETDLASHIRFSGNLGGDLLRVAEAYQDSAERNGAFFMMLLSEMPRFPELEEITHTQNQIMSKIGQLLVQYQAGGLLKEEHPLHAVAAFLGPLMIINMMRFELIKAPNIPPPDLEAHIANFISGRQI